MTLMDNLLNLFRVDAQVRGLRSRLGNAESHLHNQNRMLDILLQQQRETQTRRKHLQATIANLEVETQGIDQRLEKLRGELNSASNNKQYGALLTELNTVKEGRAAVEQRELGDMEQLEKIEAALVELEKHVAERAKVRDLAKAQLSERQADVGQRLAELEVERQAAAAVIPANVMAIFDSAAERHDGEALAPVEEINRRHREYACGSCNMHLPFEQISLLTSRNDSLVRCPNCMRILYMQEEMRGTLAKK